MVENTLLNIIIQYNYTTLLLSSDFWKLRYLLLQLIHRELYWRHNTQYKIIQNPDYWFIWLMLLNKSDKSYTIPLSKRLRENQRDFDSAGNTQPSDNSDVLIFLSLRWCPRFQTWSWGRGWCKCWMIKWVSQISACGWCQASHCHCSSVQAATGLSQPRSPLRTSWINPNRSGFFPCILSN